jgi:hypothetical protein
MARHAEPSGCIRRPKSWVLIVHEVVEKNFGEEGYGQTLDLGSATKSTQLGHEL